MNKKIGKFLIENNLTIATAESCTGGLLSSLLTDVAGSSSYIKLNLVTYSNESKIKFLKVNPKTIDDFGVVSREVALEMAIGIKKLAQCDIGIGITGIAGPAGATKDKPIGLVFIGIKYKNKEKTIKFNTPKNFERIQNKHAFAQKALELIFEVLQNIE
jgi:PncC family amidohydrolase